MPHDAGGNVLQVGDEVLVPCRVVGLQLGDDYCNCNLETAYPMPPYTTRSQITLNTRQVMKETNSEVATTK